MSALDVEDRIVAAVEAHGRPRSLHELYQALEDVVEHEDELARHLRRLVDASRLARRLRAPGVAGSGFEYDLPERDRLRTIAEAARHHDQDQAAAAAVQETTPAEPVIYCDRYSAPLIVIDQEPQMPGRRGGRPAKDRTADLDKVRSTIGALAGPESAKTIARTAGVALVATRKLLAELLDRGEVERRGHGAAQVFAPISRIAAPRASLPPSPAPVPAGRPRQPEEVGFAIESCGQLVIAEKDGAERARIKAKDVAALAEFLDLTRAIWEGASRPTPTRSSRPRSRPSTSRAIRSSSSSD
jgi:hypothetical protein